MEALADLHKPQMIIAGGSAYPRIIDFKRFREIADRVGAILLVDMAHFRVLLRLESTQARSPMPMWLRRPRIKPFVVLGEV